MATLNSTYAYHPHGNDRFKGLMLVIGLHIILVYALMSGLHRDIVKLVRPPTTIVDVPIIELPQPPIRQKQPVEPLTPQTPQTVQTDPVIKTDITTETSNSNVKIDEGTPIARVPEVAVLAQSRQAAPAEASMAVACPHMVAPEMPRRAIAEGAYGLVRATAIIRGGVVAEVTSISGPRIFHSAVRTAMLQYKCNASAGEVSATQEFNFVLSD